MGSTRSLRGCNLRRSALALPFEGRVGWGWCPPPSSFRRKPESILIFAFGFRGFRDNRLTSVCVSSTIHGRRLLSFACPKESNQRKGHPRIRAARGASGSLRADGFRPTGHPWPVVRIGAIPRAARVRCTRLFRPPSAAAQRGPEEQSERKKKKPTCRIYPVSHISDASAAGTAALCSSRVPSRPRQGLGGKAAKRWPAGCRPLRREHTDVLPAKPSESLRSLPGMDARQTATARVPFSLVTFFWASKRK